jgi:uncharacterized protein (UPF0332 family)
MAFPRDLLEQARFLVRREARKPKQASLRRAVSTAYYAVFHLLAVEAASQASPLAPAGLRSRVQRALEHTKMKGAAAGFVSNNPSRVIQPLIPQPISAALISVASNFTNLQDERHKADYDLSIPFDRARAQDAVARAEQVFAEWDAIRDTDEARVFLAALVFHERWNK